MNDFTRRDFMKGTVATGIAFAAASTVLGANDDIRVGVAGINGRGGTHINEFNKLKGARVVAICDADKRAIAKRVKQAPKAKQYVDYRHMMDDDNVDAVSIASTNHWHALMAIWACQARKDVYVEKPCSHNVFEGRKLVEAARKYKCIVQHGTQSRSSSGWAHKCALAKSGKYGKLLVAKGYCCKPRWSLGYKPITTPPASLDFNLWLGPSQLQPYHDNLVPYNWHWFFPTGNGDMGNQGVHQMDIAMWGLGKGLPKSVLSVGGRYVNAPGFMDQAETPNQIISIFDYGDCLLLFETRGLVGRMKKFPAIVENEFHCEEGVIKHNKFFPKGKDKGEPLQDAPHHVQPGGIFGNFITCVRSRRRDQLNAEIENGHLSSALCHLGNISYLMGAEKKFEDPKLSDNPVVSDSIRTMLENTQAIGVNADNAQLRVGAKLDFDAKAEKFINNPAADQMLTRDYRAPFVVPEKV